MTDVYTALSLQLNEQWASLNTNYGSFAVFCVGSELVTFGVYWITGLLFLLIDVYQPKSLVRYKVQPDASLDYGKLQTMLRRVLFNTVVINSLAGVVMYYAMLARGVRIDAPLPSPIEMIRDMVFFVPIVVIGFYYFHRMFHHKWMYKTVHKIHHEWLAPIGLSAQYAHPLEQVVSNLIPLLSGPLICGSHTVTTWVFLSIGLISTTVAHSGYHLPFLPSPEYHDFHHREFASNFGMDGFLDWFHGTDLAWRKSEQRKRHFVLLSLTPVREVVAALGEEKAK